MAAASSGHWQHIHEAAALAMGATTAPTQKCDGTPPTYPVAKEVDQVDNYFGTTIGDPYRWLEDANREDTHAWVEAENKVAQSYLARIPQRAAIRAPVHTC